MKKDLECESGAFGGRIFSQKEQKVLKTLRLSLLVRNSAQDSGLEQGE